MKKIVGIGEVDDVNQYNLDAQTWAEDIVAQYMRSFDPLGITSSVFNVQTSWLSHPIEYARAMTHVSTTAWQLYHHALLRAAGKDLEDRVVPHPDDHRFSSPEWRKPYWGLLKEVYLAITRLTHDLCYEAPGVSHKERRRAAFWLRNILNALAPTNFLLTNPTALAKLIETRGESLRQGLAYFKRDYDLKTIQMVEQDAFVVGKDLATTPGQVIARNSLVEIIYYTPTTEQVQRTPIVIITPWINKFYILDLTSKKSLVNYLVQQGFSVFITSWKNPDASMSGVSFDDYLTQGVQFAVDTAAAVCDNEPAHLVGYCIGGTMVATYMAWLNKRLPPEQFPVVDWTVFTTMTDFARPGGIEVFIDEAAVASLEKSMRQKGYLESEQMMSAFRLLRANSLIWHYWEHSYLLGEPLPAFDVLFWNTDGTRMPAEMHSYYLRHFYLENALIKSDHLTIAGEKIDLNRITQPLYAVAAEDDHIAPWEQCFRIRRFVNEAAVVRFVLSSSGHILGIINPPVDPPKRKFRASEVKANEHLDVWLEEHQPQPGSWWTDWTTWLKRHGLDPVPARQLPQHLPPITPAPGIYVLER